jgi:hypothetical protein
MNQILLYNRKIIEMGKKEEMDIKQIDKNDLLTKYLNFCLSKHSMEYKIHYQILY